MTTLALLTVIVGVVIGAIAVTAIGFMLGAGLEYLACRLQGKRWLD